MAEPLPARLPLTLYRGDSRVWDNTFTLDDEPMDLTGYTFLAQIRHVRSTGDHDEEDGSPVMATMTVTVLDAPAGRIRLELTPEESRKLVPPQARWDLQLIKPDGFTRTYLAGPVRVIRDVSRA